MNKVQFRTSLYLEGHVDNMGNITDPSFIREIEDLKYTESEVPKNCFIVSEQFDGVYWESVGNETYSSKDYVGFKDGDFCMAWYVDPNSKTELYFCEILHLGGEYCKCRLFAGDTLKSKRVYGVFNDVLKNDLTGIYN